MFSEIMPKCDASHWETTIAINLHFLILTKQFILRLLYEAVIV